MQPDVPFDCILSWTRLQIALPVCRSLILSLTNHINCDCSQMDCQKLDDFLQDGDSKKIFHRKFYVQFMVAFEMIIFFHTWLCLTDGLVILFVKLDIFIIWSCSFWIFMLKILKLSSKWKSFLFNSVAFCFTQPIDVEILRQTKK